MRKAHIPSGPFTKTVPGSGFARPTSAVPMDGDGINSSVTSGGAVNGARPILDLYGIEEDNARACENGVHRFANGAMLDCDEALLPCAVIAAACRENDLNEFIVCELCL